MKRLPVRLIALTASVAVIAATALTSASGSTAAAPSTTGTAAAQQLSAPITGTTANGGSFLGTFTASRFVYQNHQALGVGQLTGTLTRANGATRHVDQQVQLPVTSAAFDGTQQSSTDGLKLDPAAAAAGSCRILNLVLGPLNLDLLGLVVHLNMVHLVITAVTGPGQLLGNLLCAIANLLNGVPMSGLLAKLVTVLNRILGALGG